MMSERVPLYRRAATIRVNTNRRNPGAVVRYLVSRLDNPTAVKQARRRRRPPWRFSPVRSTEDGATPPTPATPAALAAKRAENRE
jgi:shikimate kinase